MPLVASIVGPGGRASPCLVAGHRPAWWPLQARRAHQDCICACERMLPGQDVRARVGNGLERVHLGLGSPP